MRKVQKLDKQRN